MLAETFPLCSAYPLQMHFGRQTQLWKIRKIGCTAFRKLICVKTQCFLEEAFNVFGRNLTILGRSPPLCGGDMPQTYFGKAFRITASILKTRTVPYTYITHPIMYGQSNIFQQSQQVFEYRNALISTSAAFNSTCEECMVTEVN